MAKIPIPLIVSILSARSLQFLLEASPSERKNVLIKLEIFFIALILSLLMVWVHFGFIRRGDFLLPGRNFLLLLIPLYFLCKKVGLRFSYVFIWVLGFFILILLFPHFSLPNYFLNPFFKTSLFISVATLLSIVLMSLYYFSKIGGQFKKITLMAMIFLFSYVAIYPFPPITRWMEISQNLILAYLGMVRFFLIAILFEKILCHFQIERIKQFLFAILLIELLGYNKIFSRQIRDAFVDEPLYKNTNSSLSEFDLKQFRVNQPQKLLQIYPFETPQSNLSMVYSIRTYSGVNSVIPKETIDYLRLFESNLLYTPGMLGSGPINERLLLLFSCRYDLGGQDNPRLLKGSLSRFRLFSQVHVIHHPERLKMTLLNPKWNPQNSLIVSGTESYFTQGINKASVPVPYQELTSSKIKLDYEFPHHAALLFNDIFHLGWSAFIDGKKIPIERANGIFMSITVPKGRHSILFNFEPIPFLWGKKLTLFGLILFPIYGWFFCRTSLKRTLKARPFN